MKLRLVKLTEQYRTHLNDMMDEWCGTGEKIIPYAIRKNDYHDFQNYMDHLDVTEEEEGLVSDSTFFCMDSLYHEAA